MKNKLSTNVEVIVNDGEEMYFFGSFEIEKPKMLTVPVGKIVAFSAHGLGGKKHLFTAEQVACVKDMDVAETPKWLV